LSPLNITNNIIYEKIQIYFRIQIHLRLHVVSSQICSVVLALLTQEKLIPPAPSLAKRRGAKAPLFLREGFFRRNAFGRGEFKSYTTLQIWLGASV